jgi:hypothetical protein
MRIEKKALKPPAPSVFLSLRLQREQLFPAGGAK